MPTYKEIYSQAKKRLEEAGIECVKSELLNIFWYCFGINRLNLIVCGSDIPEATRYNEFCRIIRQRCSGVPIQYAIGKCNFMDMDIDVGEGVLIPREDTSVLVNASLDAIKNVKIPKLLIFAVEVVVLRLPLREDYVGRVTFMLLKFQRKHLNICL